MAMRSSLTELAERISRISADPSWSGPGSYPEGDIDDIRDAVHELRDCLSTVLRVLEAREAGHG